MMNKFETLEKIGEGAYSSVHKVRRLIDGEVYAMKRVRLGELSEKEKQNALNEIRILASIEDDCVVGYKVAHANNSRKPSSMNNRTRYAQ